MALARFIFGIPQKKIGSLIVDAFTSEKHSRKNAVTKYPVEEGEQLSDHIISEPEMLSVTGIIEPILDGFNLIVAYDVLKNIYANKELISIVTGLEVYGDMAMLQLDVNRNSRNGGSLSFSASFQKVKIVSSQTVDISVKNINEIDQESYEQAQPTVDVGKATNGQNTEPSLMDQLKQWDGEFNEIIGDPIFGPE